MSMQEMEDDAANAQAVGAAEEKPRQSEVFINSVVEHLPNMVFVKDASDLRFVGLNKAGEELLGHRRDELLGKNDYDFFPKSEADFFTDKDREVLASGNLLDVPEEIIHTTKGPRILHTKKVPISDGDGVPKFLLGISEDITERKRVEAALRYEHERLTLALTAGQMGVYDLDLVHDRLWWSPETYAVFGVSPEEFAPTAQGFGNFLHPDDREGFWRHLADTLHTRSDFVYEFRILRPDGTLRWIGNLGRTEYDATGSPLRHYGVAVDITERKQAEEALRDSENRLRLALVSGQMGTWDVDFVTGETKWDGSEYALLGLTPGQVRPSPEYFYARVHPDERSSFEEAVRDAVENSREFLREFRIIRADGAVRWLVGRGRMLHDQHGQPRRMFGVNYDVTERKMVEERLEQLVHERTEALTQSHDRLRALATELNLTEQRERKRLAAELHDHLQQMLVVGRIKLGRGKQLAESIPACAKLIQETADLLSDALTYTRTLVAELSPPVLRDHGLPMGLKWLGEYMQKHDMAVTVTVMEEPLKLPDDQALLLFQSVRELLMNAWKHAQTDKAEITMQVQDARLRIEVRDHGKGFDLAAAETHPSPGLASKFGLFSIHERMKALRGSFTIESAPGQGTTARLTLPLSASSRTAEAVTPLHASHAVSGTQTPLSSGARVREHGRVLLVDDHAMVRQGLRTMLESYAGVEVVGEACNGVEALALVEQLRPTIVVMDINMPKMNGIEATAHLKAHYPNLTIIGLSVNAEEENQEAMREAGAMTLITKEAAVDQLYAAIQQVRS